MQTRNTRVASRSSDHVSFSGALEVNCVASSFDDTTAGMTVSMESEAKIDEKGAG